jgi:hypothetical protein
MQGSAKSSGYLVETFSAKGQKRGWKKLTKMIKIKVLVLLVAILTVTLAVSPAQACACGENWSKMSAEKMVSEINNAEAHPRIMEGESGQLPPAPEGYEYDENYNLVPTP